MINIINMNELLFKYQNGESYILNIIRVLVLFNF